MTDIFHEVEEEVRRERLEKLWKQYGDYVIAGVAVLVIGIAGYELWQRYDASQRQKASIALNAATEIAGADPLGAADSFGKIAATAPHGYALMAKMSEAATLAASGQQAKAVALYRAIADSDGGQIGKAARLRAAWATADTAPRRDLETLLAPLTDPNSPWRYMASEVLAYADYRANDLHRAGGEFDSIAKDPSAPQGLRERARVMAALVRAGGQANFGYVPPPEAKQPTPASPAQQGPIPQ